MKRKLIIDKLSKELSILLKRQDQYELIRQYIESAITTEIERSYGRDLQIYQKIHPISGVIVDEFYGMEEIFDEIKKETNANKRTIKVSISKAVNGLRNTAYGFCWKRV